MGRGCGWEVVREAYHVEGGGVCEHVINEKRGGSVCTCVESYWTYGGMDGEKRRGEVYMCLL